MVQHVKMQQLTSCSLNVLNSRVAKFHHLVAVGANQVVMLSRPIGFLVLGKVFSELMSAHKVTFNQQVKGIVNRGPANPVVFILHVDVQRLYIKMAWQ